MQLMVDSLLFLPWDSIVLVMVTEPPAENLLGKLSQELSPHHLA